MDKLKQKLQKDSIGNTNSDLVVDNYTQAVKGCVRLVVNAYFDAKVLRASAFAFGKTVA